MTKNTWEQDDNDHAWLLLAIDVAEASVIHNTMQFDVICSWTAMAKIIHEMETKFHARHITTRGNTFGHRLTFHRNDWVIRDYQINHPELLSFKKPRT